MEKVKYNGISYNLDLQNRLVLDFKERKLSKQYFQSLGISEAELFETLVNLLKKQHSATYYDEEAFKLLLSQNLEDAKNKTLNLGAYNKELTAGINYKIIKTTNHSDSYGILTKIADTHNLTFKTIELNHNADKNSLKKIKTLYPRLEITKTTIAVPKVLLPIISSLIAS